MSSQESREYRARLREMTEVLKKHGITRGVSPGRSCAYIRRFRTYLLLSWTDYVVTFGYSAQAVL